MKTMILNGSQIGGKGELWKRFLPMTFNIVTWILGDVLGIITSRFSGGCGFGSEHLESHLPSIYLDFY